MMFGRKSFSNILLSDDRIEELVPGQNVLGTELGHLLRGQDQRLLTVLIYTKYRFLEFQIVKSEKTWNSNFTDCNAAKNVSKNQTS
jgi:hypothetical protein